MTSPGPSAPVPAPSATPAATGALPGLRDIHPPPDVPFWPPAPGWIGLAALLVLVLLVLAVREWRFRRTLAYQALREFDARAGSAPAGDARALAAAASGVMKRLAQAGEGKAMVQTGDDWAAYLCAGKAGFDAETAAFLALAPYLPPDAGTAPPIDPARLSSAVRRWIRARA